MGVFCVSKTRLSVNLAFTFFTKCYEKTEKTNAVHPFFFVAIVTKRHPLPTCMFLKSGILGIHLKFLHVAYPPEHANCALSYRQPENHPPSCPITI